MIQTTIGRPAAALFLALSLPLAAAQSSPSDFAKSTPGITPGTELWIVHFEKRDFDLRAFRTAVMQRKTAAEVDRIVAGLEASAERHQRGFVAAVERLGGSLVSQWWLVNACAIDTPRAALPTIAAMPNVARLQPNRMVYPVIGTATDANNHNADFVQQQLGMIGTGVTAAVMDTGQDSAMAGSSRPHRTYFINGDPTNTSGPGIGGSRLVTNQAIGAMPADDVHDHGTGVASIVGGGDWGTTRADHGHAYGAGLAGYSIANAPNGGSDLQTVTNAWQAIAADRVRFNIVSANNSYSGASNPQDISQLALDSAAFNADILVACSAGNASGSTSNSQSVANGLAVAAINANSHTMASFSSRGPLSGSSRFYPDISACGVSTVMAQRDNESADYVQSGTSMASPQVCGAAALMRSANTALTAAETKALLLASVQDISSANPNPPYNSRNAYGLGMLRDDLAVQGAIGGTYGSSTTASTASIPLPVTIRGGYRVVVTWLRDPGQSAGWSNLDIEILDASNNVLASSSSPQNLYEVVEFASTSNATYSIRVTATGLQSGLTTQPFSYAVHDIPPPPVPGLYSTFGAGCPGSGPVCPSQNPAGGQLNNTVLANEFAFTLSAPQALTVTGVRFYMTTHTGGSTTVPVNVYGDTGGIPSNTPLATTTMTVGGSTGFYTATFAAPVSVPAGRSYMALGPAFEAYLPSLVSGQSGTGYWRRPGLTNWARGTLADHGSLQVICQNAGGGAIPVLGNVGEPTVSGTYDVNLASAIQSGSAVLLTGLSNTTFGGVALPFDLTPLGAPGCSLLVSGEFAQSTTTDPLGLATVPVTLPNDTNLIGAEFHQQFAILDGFTALGIVTSNAGTGRIGS